MSDPKPTFEFPEMEPEKRLTELLLYVAKKLIDESKYGKVKLVKVLYHADFGSYRLYGEPITGSRYVKLQQGPFPDNFEQLLDMLKVEGHIIIRRVRVYDHDRIQIIPTREANLSIFSGRDIALVDEIIEDQRGQNAKEASVASHGIPWEVSIMTQPIAYETSLILDEPPTADDIVWLEEQADLHGWDD